MDYIAGNNLFLGYIRDRIIRADYKYKFNNIKTKSQAINIYPKNNFYTIF